MFDDPNSTSRMAKILIPLSAPLGAFSTAGCFAIDLPSTQVIKTDAEETDTAKEQTEETKEETENRHLVPR